MRILTVLLSSLLVAGATAAQAQDVGQHPAVFAPRQLTGVNPSTFIVGHPASPTWRIGQENHEHPAVVVKHEWAAPSIDPNTFIVQPPAHVRWTAGRAPEVSVATSVVEVPGS